ncbi:MAG TPA: hypothetical protein VFY35_15480 [Burkholderiaceae bacterium]|nr:hypothetical protein [Burkholderiaceae bacterium]
MWMLLHVWCAGMWLGCVLTEVVFERTLADQSGQANLPLARLHWWVDVWVEGPLLLAVGLTGVAGWPSSHATAPLHTMAVLGGLAIVANLWCMRLVWLRMKAAQAGHHELYTRLDHAQHRWGAVVLLGLLGAASAGAWRHLG